MNLSDRPHIDYTDKDFDSLRRALLSFAELRLPEWTDRNPADFGMLMLDLFAYVGDTILYYQDRMANELFLDTAIEPASIFSHLALIGYQPAAAQPAFAELDLSFTPGPPSVLIPTGAQFRTVGVDPPQIFEFREGDLLINLASDQVEPDALGNLVYRRLPVRQGISVAPTVIGSAVNEANQAFRIGSGLVIADSVELDVDEGSGWVRWDRRDSLLHDVGPDGRLRMSTPDARHYVVITDASGQTWAQFGGDGRFGRRPPAGSNNIRAAFAQGGGATGNVAAGTIREALTGIAGLVSVANAQAATGGQDAEAAMTAAQHGPAAFRARDRAVSTADYEAMAIRAGGVEKAHARATSWNGIDLFIAPAAPHLIPSSEALKRKLTAFMDERKMAGTIVRILDAVPVPVDVIADIYYDERYRPDAVRQLALDAINAQLAYQRLDFGQPVYLGEMHNAVLSVAGVRAANFRRFARTGAGDNGVDALLAQANLPPLGSLPASVREALTRQVELDGRIEVAHNEIATPGHIEVAMMVGGI